MKTVMKNGRALKCSESKLRANRKYYTKNRDILAAKSLERYHAKKERRA